MAKKSWIAEYQGSEIRIENTWLGEKLFVNGVLQDEQIGLGIRSRLFGIATRQDGSKVDIRVSLGSLFTVECRLFVDNNYVPVRRA